MFRRVPLVTLYVLLLAGCSDLVEAQNNFTYRAQLTVNGTVDGDVASRQAEVASSVASMLAEIGSGLTYDLTSTTLEQLTTGTPSSQLVVSLVFANISQNADGFTALLTSTSYTTTINGSSVTASDFDECHINYGNCSNDADCTNSNGSFACACKGAFVDRSPSGTAGFVCEVPFTVNCLSNGATVDLDTQYTNNLGIATSDVKFGTCSGTLNGTVLMFSGYCDAYGTDNGTHIFLSWNLTNVNDSEAFQHSNYFTYPVSCFIDKTTNVSSQYNNEQTVISPPIGNTLIFSVDAQNLNFKIQAFSDSSFSASSQITSGSTLKTTDTINFAFDSPLTIPNVAISCTHMTVQSAANPATSIRLLENGCKSPTTSQNSQILSRTRIVSNCVPGRAKITSQPVRFLGSPTTTVSTRLQLTLLTGGASTCSHSCASRKRSVVSVRIARSSDEIASGDASFQYVFDPDAPECSKDCGAGACVHDHANNEFCVCPDSYFVDDNGVCREKGPSLPGAEETAVDNTVLYILIGLGVLIVFLIFALALIIYNRRYGQKILA